MSSQEQFRQFANECMTWARRAGSERERNQYLDMAKLWMTAAQQFDDGMTGMVAPPLSPPPAKAS